MTRLNALRTLRQAEHGFTMILALSVMLVTSLLLAGGFAAVNEDFTQSHDDTAQKQAYYAALAGIEQYTYKLQNNPNYWETCEAPSGEESGQHYEIKLLPASTAKVSSCNPESPFAYMIESKGNLVNTFRIESIGCAGKGTLTKCEGEPHKEVVKRRLVATFQVVGFLNYVYFTQYELVDPKLYSHPHAKCEEYYEEGGRSSECRTLIFAENDSVHGPMHTDDAANVTCSSKVTFGREGQNPLDAVEINGGTWPECGASGPKFNTPTGLPSVGHELEPPENDTSLDAYVEHEPQENELQGRNELILNGENETITDNYYKKEGAATVSATRTLKWPANGLIYDTQNTEIGICEWNFTNNEASETDNATELADTKGCGNVVVHGTFGKKSLTIAAENELIINKNITPYGITPGAEPTGTATLGLIASKFVRVYHPASSCSGFSNGNNLTGSLENPWIYAAILSTAHSFIVDNYMCGPQMGKLGVYGAIAQKFRGPVGTVGNSGYIKEYKYDERLATDEPPYFLAPLKSGWSVIRETASNENN